jgi:hypothetical protein
VEAATVVGTGGALEDVSVGPVTDAEVEDVGAAACLPPPVQAAKRTTPSEATLLPNGPTEKRVAVYSWVRVMRRRANTPLPSAANCG